jgi:release factor H-coupled RctB family protein
MEGNHILNENFTIIANEKCWIEQPAVEQLKAVAALPGVIRTVGLPDLHPGKTPVGVAIETDGVVYPHIIGNDIGCGMGLFETNCRVKKFKQDRFFKKLNDIKSLRDLPAENPFPEPSPIPDLGTIGGGNHFAEFQAVEKIYDAEVFQRLNIDREQVLLLVHSGSRSYGDKILDGFPELGGVSGENIQGYITAHDYALLWAQRNRVMVARKLTEYLGYATELKKLIDCHHNFVERLGERYIHRKGAVSSLVGSVIIPGSRGSFTYIVEPAEDTTVSLFSLSHGAGRKWIRSLCKGRLKDKYHRDAIHDTRLGSKTVCHDTNLLYEEAPEAYKGIEYIIDALVQFGLCKVVATLRPLITFKA